jgi:hypothetical protein
MTAASKLRPVYRMFFSSIIALPLLVSIVPGYVAYTTSGDQHEFITGEENSRFYPPP